jgi:hypothetical protein
MTVLNHFCMTLEIYYLINRMVYVNGSTYVRSSDAYGLKVSILKFVFVLYRLVLLSLCRKSVAQWILDWRTMTMMSVFHFDQVV